MFDVGFWEISIIALIALIILGPERLPRAARSIGLWVGKARRTLAEVKRDIDREIDATELKELKSIKDDLMETKDIVEEDLKDTKNIFEEAASTLNEDVMDDHETVAVKPEFVTPEPADEEKSAVGETKTAS